MKFSCVMTVFNEGALCAQSIASVLNQTHADLQLVIVADGADAATLAVLEAQEDPRITLLYQSNDGLSAARNRGLQHCTGDYICFLDGDDLRAPWAFAEVAAALAEEPVELLLVRGAFAQPQGALQWFMDEDCGRQAERAAAERAAEAEAGPEPGPEPGAGGTGGLDLATTRAWAVSHEPQSANKFIARSLIERARLRFPNGHFFEDILFHVLCIAQARSLRLLPSRSFTYFRRQQRPQLTGASSDIRFDVIACTRVMFQLMAAHPACADPRFRGAVSIGALRLLKWCESCIARHQLGSYRALLRAALRQVDPAFFVISERAPDPRQERQLLQDYAQAHLLARRA